MNEIQLFNYGNSAVRVVMYGTPQAAWFVAKDVCDILGYANVTDTLNKHLDTDERNTLAIHEGNRGNPVVNIISESGLYCLILRSNMPKAIEFRKWEHRSDDAKARITKFMSFPESDLRSCYYHVGNTDVKSIFFISDVIPIIDKYLEREYQGTYTHKHYIIQNKMLIQELTRKVRRIISFERGKPNYFRQHITDIKVQLISELNN